MEAFNDTPVVNGTAYPTLKVDPKAYRMRILNAANDRFWNLSLYEASGTGCVPSTGEHCTEVALNSAGGRCREVRSEHLPDAGSRSPDRTGS